MLSFATVEPDVAAVYALFRASLPMKSIRLRKKSVDAKEDRLGDAVATIENTQSH